MHKALLLDLGNVVLGIDFRRVFTSWAAAAGVDEQVFYDGWAMDQAYRDHEVGAIDFEAYTRTLADRFEVDLSLEAWRAGWNALWTSPFHDVIELLPLLAERYELCAFTNTNDTHAEAWRSRFASELAPLETIFVSSEIGLRKPDIAAFAYVCNQMRTDPAQIMFLDDTLDNVSGARDAGLDARHVAGERQVLATLRALLT